jgi:FMN reductase
VKIVGVGGTTNPQSSTESALRLALASAAAAGAQTMLFGAETLVHLPHYSLPASQDCVQARAMVHAIREADGIILASPGYHGAISGLVKNAIDYLEETARDPRVYLDGVPVGLIATAYGWQATGSTLAGLRSIVHALRGWPTPLGAAIKVEPGLFDGGQCTRPDVTAQLEMVGRQVVELAALRRLHGSQLATGSM